MEWLAILLAIAGGFTYALAAVMQQRVAAEQPSELSLSFKSGGIKSCNEPGCRRKQASHPSRSGTQLDDPLSLKGHD